MREDANEIQKKMEIEGLANSLHVFAIRLLRLLRKEDEASGLSASRLSALSVLVFGGPASLGALARAEQVKPPTMTKLVQGLENEGLVCREPDPKDKRSLRIRATDRGHELMNRARERRMVILADLLGDLSEKDLETLMLANPILGDLLNGESGSRENRDFNGNS